MLKNRVLWNDAAARLALVELLIMMYWNENRAEQFVNVAYKGMDMNMLVQVVCVMFNNHFDGMKHARIEKAHYGKNSSDFQLSYLQTTKETRVITIIG